MGSRSSSSSSCRDRNRSTSGDSSSTATALKADVYSLAHLLYRVWTAGRQDPALQHLGTVQCLHKLHIEGYRPPLPPLGSSSGCGGSSSSSSSSSSSPGWPSTICHLIQPSWSRTAQDRPHVTCILDVLECARARADRCIEQGKAAPVDGGGGGGDSGGGSGGSGGDSESMATKLSVGMGLHKTSSAFEIRNPISIAATATATTVAAAAAVGAAPLRFTEENQNAVLSPMPM